VSTPLPFQALIKSGWKVNIDRGISAARLALCNFEALTLQLNKPLPTDTTAETSTAAAEEAEADHERIQDDLEDATGCITDTIKRFLAQGVAHHLPIST
jgi:hypothetical protein